MTLGPITNNALAAVTGNEDLNKIADYRANTFPLEMPDDIQHILGGSAKIIVAEEHVSTGGLAQQLSVQMLEKGIRPETFLSLRAAGYPDHKYGSQQFHQKNAQLDAAGIEANLLNLLQSA